MELKLQNTELSSKNLDHLGLVAGMCQELRIAETIDTLIPNPGCGKKISYGNLIVSMILNGLGFTSKALYLSSDFFRDKAISRLFKDKIKAEDINDDVLGRALDVLYKNNVNVIYSNIAKNTYHALNLDSKYAHLDSTSFSTEGNYNSADDMDEKLINITKGYSKDHRPDLNQCILNLIVENKASIPLLMKEASGNSSDKKSFAEMVNNHISQLKNDYGINYLIADSALYTEDSIKTLNKKSFFITRVPEITNEAKAAVKLAINNELKEIDDNYSYIESHSSYGNCQQRWIIIHSKASQIREESSLNKKLLKLTKSEYSKVKKFQRTLFCCEADAEKTFMELKKTLKLIECDDFQLISTKYKNEEKFKYQGDILIPINSKEKLKKYCGYFILATNQLDEKTLPPSEILFAYKGQDKVEKGFKFLKSPHFLTQSFFVKKVERVTALLMIMTLCLMVYSALEYRIRESLKLAGLYILSQTKKKTRTPTAKWVFECFSGIHVVKINRITEIILNLREQQTTIIKCLGNLYEKIYS